MDHARKLHERIRREFPELRVYKFWEVSSSTIARIPSRALTNLSRRQIPVGPHAVPMCEAPTYNLTSREELLSRSFSLVEVNTFTPAQFGALFGFLVAFRGGLS